MLIGKLLSYAGLTIAEQENERLMLELIQLGVDDERLRELFHPYLDGIDFEPLREVRIAKRLSDEALELLASKAVDLLFTDVVMPGGMSGYELRQKVRELYPQMSVLLTSGYAEELTGDRIKRDADLKILRKPYRMADLAAAIDDALKAKGTSA